MKTQGFTLIELLIVMVLIGLMTGMAMLSMGNADRSKPLQLEAQRLSKLLLLAEQEAMIRGEGMAIELFQEGYRFLSWRQGQWQPETLDSLFKPRNLDAGIQLSFQLERESVYLNPRAGMTQQPRPQIVLAPDGGIEDLQIGIQAKNSETRYLVANSDQEGWRVANLESRP
ncbi:type II secretion system minor pseudopilin GspH [Methylomonas sp. LL1]|uniref:type II secretion system minor pseudopilin GspH n=1 Tax=Methylomonas sp. LL1 TaxID=2785785 RepID=UPI0018C3C45B|nr:type II secretion system minor pseudopilin GspH [Methylomonas sp. LL1]QPK64729.1 type II secretion system minor pseudopilin GspH [Methylomonas sp. LL1]